jgi:cytochrome c-type biogenesis protein
MTDLSERSRPIAWAFVLIVVSVIWLEWETVKPVLLAFVRAVDGFAFSAYNTISNPLFGFRSSPIPLLAPLVIGLMASTAPCQLSLGTASLAFVAQDGQPGGALRRGLAFVLGRVLMYAIFGGIVMFALGGSLQAPRPLLSTIRKLIGPLTMLVGLVTLGALPFRLQLGANLSERFKDFSETRGGMLGALLLGIAFSFAFCPTLFLLFFGLTVPLALTVPLGFAYPVVFAIGMGLPLLAFAWLISRASPTQDLLGGMRRSRRWLTPLAGVMFVLAGVFDTLRYWLIY